MLISTMKTYENTNFTGKGKYISVSPADAPGRDQKGAAQASPADACR